MNYQNNENNQNNDSNTKSNHNINTIIPNIDNLKEQLKLVYMVRSQPYKDTINKIVNLCTNETHRKLLLRELLIKPLTYQFIVNVMSLITRLSTLSSVSELQPDAHFYFIYKIIKLGQLKITKVLEIINKYWSLSHLNSILTKLLSLQHIEDLLKYPVMGLNSKYNTPEFWEEETLRTQGLILGNHIHRGGSYKIRTYIVKKKIRKHKGIYQTGPLKGTLKVGYKYSKKKTKTGLKIIIKNNK